MHTDMVLYNYRKEVRKMSIKKDKSREDKTKPENWLNLTTAIVNLIIAVINIIAIIKIG